MKKKKVEKNFSRKIFLGILIITIIFIFVYFIKFNKNFEEGVKRSLSHSTVSPGEEIRLILSTNIEEGKKFYIIEERVPKEFEILNFSYEDNIIKIFNMENTSGDKKHEYSLISPKEEGIYYFEGKYALEGDEEPREIRGRNKIIVKDRL